MAKKRMTPELYFPCRNCGQWRRAHVGSERKCLFQASRFEPKAPLDFTARERGDVLRRVQRLQHHLVERRQRALEAVEQEIGKISDAASSGCTHHADDGVSLLERYSPPPDDKGNIPTQVHVVCTLCDEDWYE